MTNAQRLFALEPEVSSRERRGLQSMGLPVARPARRKAHWRLVGLAEVEAVEPVVAANREVTALVTTRLEIRRLQANFIRLAIRVGLAACDTHGPQTRHGRHAVELEAFQVVVAVARARTDLGRGW